MDAKYREAIKKAGALEVTKRIITNLQAKHLRFLKPTVLFDNASHFEMSFRLRIAYGCEVSRNNKKAATLEGTIHPIPILSTIKQNTPNFY